MKNNPCAETNPRLTSTIPKCRRIGTRPLLGRIATVATANPTTRWAGCSLRRLGGRGLLPATVSGALLFLLPSAARAADLNIYSGNSPYDYTSGNLNYDNINIGVGEVGTLNQTGGSLTSTNLYIGLRDSSYNLSAGTIEVTSDTFVGVKYNVGTGSGQGIVNLSGTGVFKTNNETLGYGSGGGFGQGLFSQTGGTHIVSGTLTVGGFGLISRYFLAGGTLTASAMLIGSPGNFPARCDQDGGVLVAGTEVVGNGTNGTFLQAGGTHTISGTLTVGAQSGGDGNYYFTDGTLDASNAVGGIIIGQNAGSSGRIDFWGGVLKANSIAGGAGMSTVNLFGGTLQAGAANASFFSGVDTVCVHCDGAKIDTNGFATSIAAPLLHPDGWEPNDGGLTKLGAGTLTLFGANTYNGGTFINAGTLNVGSIGALGSTGAIDFGGGTLQYSSANTSDYSVRIRNSTTGPIAIDTNGQFVAFVSTLDNSNTGGLNKRGAGTLVLGGNLANTYTGVTQVNGGTLQLSKGAAGPANDYGAAMSGSLVVNNGGTVRYGADSQVRDAMSIGVLAGGLLDLNGFAESITNLTVNGGSVTTGAGYLNVRGAITADSSTTSSYAGNLHLEVPVANQGRTIAVDTGGIFTISGVIANGDNGLSTQLAKIGLGTLVLGGANTFTGNTRVGFGTLALANSLALQNSTLDLVGSDTGTVSFGPLTSATLGGLQGSRNLALTNANSNPVALSAGNNNASTTYSGVLSGAGSFTKTGAGTLALQGANTYTGTTTISAGKLAVTGTFTSAMTATAGTLAPFGLASTTGAVSIPSGGRFQVQLDGSTPGSGYDQLTTSGSVTLGGVLDIIAAPGLAPGSNFTVLDKTSTGAISGTFVGLPNNSVFTADGYLWSITYTGGDGNDVVLHLATALEEWRYTNFGTIANTATAADTFDANNDGEANLLEFATGQNPTAATRATPALVRNGATLDFTYTRSLAALADGVSFTVEWSDTLAAGSWSSAGVSGQILADNGTVQTVRASVAAGGGATRFLHLKISRP